MSGFDPGARALARRVTSDRVTLVTKNLFDKASATTGAFLAWNTGVPSASAQYDYSGFIAVEPGRTYTGKADNNTNMRFVTCYDASKQLVSAAGAAAAVDMFTVPAGVAFVRVTIWHSGIDSFQFEEGTARTAFSPFGTVRFRNMAVALAEIDLGDVGASPWSGRTWATLGDSITAGATWQGAVAAALGLAHSGFGIGGSRISGAPGDANAMCQDARIDAIPTGIDLVTMMGGTNDWAQNVALGAADSADPTTFNGALNGFAAKAFARWPTRRIALATTPYGEIVDWTGRPGWTSAARNGLGLTTSDYAAAIRAAAVRLHLPCIDVAAQAGFGPLNLAAALGGSTTDHLHPAPGSVAARGIASAHRGTLEALAPI